MSSKGFKAGRTRARSHARPKAAGRLGLLALLLALAAPSLFYAVARARAARHHGHQGEAAGPRQSAGAPARSHHLREHPARLCDAGQLQTTRRDVEARARAPEDGAGGAHGPPAGHDQRHAAGRGGRAAGRGRRRARRGRRDRAYGRAGRHGRAARRVALALAELPGAGGRAEARRAARRQPHHPARHERRGGPRPRLHQHQHQLPHPQQDDGHGALDRLHRHVLGFVGRKRLLRPADSVRPVQRRWCSRPSRPTPLRPTPPINIAVSQTSDPRAPTTSSASSSAARAARRAATRRASGPTSRCSASTRTGSPSG